MDDDTTLEGLLAEAIHEIERGNPRAVERICDEHPAHADRLRRLVERIGSLGLDVGSAADEPQRIGDYDVVRRLGVGGMGVVYEAEHRALGRRVALKRIRPERLMAASSRERFWREARAVSRLDHPNICPVYEVDEADGMPFMAMRLCHGETVAQHVAARRAEDRPWRSRAELDALLEIFEKCARALHHAHEAGIVHRDVKPANVLLEPRSPSSDDAGARSPRPHLEPVVLDFGLARSDGEGSLTLTGDTPGTPAYMSPEQIRPDDAPLDGRSDVYSLGVTLYECATLQAPFDGSSVREIQDSVLRDTPRPLHRVCAWMPRDLSVVVAKAMEKDRAARYQSAAEFADDLARIRLLQPIRARAPGAWTRLRRWTQRNPAAAAAVAILSVSVVAVSVLAYDLEHARSEAVTARNAVVAANEDLEVEVRKFAAMNRFILGGLRTAVDPGLGGRHDASVVDMLRTAVVEVDRTRFELREVEAYTRFAIAECLLQTGRFREAVDQAERALAIFEEVLPAGHRTLDETREFLVRALQIDAQMPRALELAKLRLAEATADGATNRTRNARARVATLLADTGDVPGSLAEIDTLLPELMRAPIDDPKVQEELAAIGATLVEIGSAERAVAPLRRALAGAEVTGGPVAPATARILANLGFALFEVGEREEAETKLRTALDVMRETLAPDHPHVAGTRAKLAVLLLGTGRLDEAEEHARAAADGLERSLGTHLTTARAHNTLGVVLRKRMRLNEARAHYETALAMRKELLGPDHVLVASVYNNLGALETLVKNGDLDEADALHREALRIRKAVLGLEHENTQWSIVRLAEVARKRFAIDDFRALEEQVAAWYGEDHLLLGRIRAPLAFVLRTRNRLVESEGVARQAAAVLCRHLPEQEDLLGRAIFHIAHAIEARVEIRDEQRLQVDDAVARLEALRADCAAVWNLPAGHEAEAAVLTVLAEVRAAVDRRTALQEARQALEMMRVRGLGERDWRTSMARQAVRKIARAPRTASPDGQPTRTGSKGR